MSTWWTGRRVTVTGGQCFVGTPVVRVIEMAGGSVLTFSSRDYDLTRHADVVRMYADQRPEIVIHLAARVGGIGANRTTLGTSFMRTPRWESR